MNKKMLCVALLAGIGFAQAAAAQEFDDRWYVTGSAGYNFQDSDRLTDSAPFGTIGLGKFITPNWSIDGELNYQNPNFEDNDDLNFSQYGISFDARYHFIDEGRSWNPYLLMGLGYQRAEEEFDNFPNPDSPGQQEDGHAAAKLGVGVQSTFDKRVAVRAELAYRIDGHNDSMAALRSDPNHDDGEDWFGDILASIGVVIPLGPAPTAPVAPAPAAPSCAD